MAFTSRAAPELIVTVLPTSPKAVVLPAFKIPLEIVTPPVKVFAPESIMVPAPVLIKPPATGVPPALWLLVNTDETSRSSPLDAVLPTLNVVVPPAVLVPTNTLLSAPVPVLMFEVTVPLTVTVPFKPKDPQPDVPPFD